MIAFDATDAGTTFDNASGPGTISHTCTGSNGLLLVGVGGPVTSMTYAGASMTFLTGGQDSNVGSISIYGILNPNTGANNIIAQWTGAAFIRFIGASYTGVKQSGLPDNTNVFDNTNSSTSTTGTITTLSSPTWAFAVTRSQNPPTVGAGQTGRGTIGATNPIVIGDSNSSISPAGTYAMTTTQGTASTMIIAQVSFADIAQVSSFMTTHSKFWGA